MRTFVAAKIVGLHVTHRRPAFTGSQSMPPSIMRAAGIKPFEQIHVANLHNGMRWITYAIEGEEGEVVLNSAAAHMGAEGDELVVMTYRTEDRYTGGTIAHADAGNRLTLVDTYPADRSVPAGVHDANSEQDA